MKTNIVKIKGAAKVKLSVLSIGDNFTQDGRVMMLAMNEQDKPCCVSLSSGVISLIEGDPEVYPLMVVSAKDDRLEFKTK